MELNVELISASRSTTGNITYTFVSCIARCDLRVLFHMEPSSVSIELSRKKIHFLQHYRYLC